MKREVAEVKAEQLVEDLHEAMDMDIEEVQTVLKIAQTKAAAERALL